MSWPGLEIFLVPKKFIVREFYEYFVFANCSFDLIFDLKNELRETH